MKPTCSVEGCDKEARARGLCSKHYQRWRRTGSTKAPERGYQPCGTYAAYQRHRRRGEEPCEPCRVARSEYLREWRQRTGDPLGHALGRARSRAFARLAARHPDEMRELLEDELAKEPA